MTQPVLPEDFTRAIFDIAKRLDRLERSAHEIGSAPAGAAGGVLAGFYPNPAFAQDMATQAELEQTAIVWSVVMG